MPQDRQTLRRHLRQARRALSAEQQRRASQQLAHRLNDRPEIQRAQTIALYLANDGEPSLMPLARLLWQQQKTLMLPVMHRDNGREMLFQRFEPDTPMAINRYHIAEPVWAPEQVIAREGIDLMLLPLVGFDHLGNRLGMGAGFYDRYLEGNSPRPLLVGIAHECQRLERLDHQSWDIPLNAVATPEHWLDTREDLRR
ncbi:5-formyltetrahydrofolate cyclo-ligase [Ferrimonas sediminicola]|uniref:5-formyltetrahydrofolate cyclo-ligase n=1 Tax=Ferrimonas sediminicola TaxID=2569538 RepID=A0A4U1BEB9_9GAMM|nr:5-formyltetrahydrofolate cyclo-ligase [Ferrimonas sediminicola]TKB48674.1 5-formyltetrahydrofolate cyclo-ligase [Ferrimonas sediminicola]